MTIKNIIIADDHPIVRIGVQSFVHQFDPSIQVDLASNISDLQFLLAEKKHQLLIQDVFFGENDARDFIQEIIQKFGISVIAISTDDNAPLVKTLMGKGVKAFVSKAENLEELIDALNAIILGETFLSPAIQKKLKKYEENMDSIRLTKREMDVLQEAIKEKTNKEIAAVLFISEKTVEIHKTNLYTKLGVKNLAGLVNKAHELKLIKK